VAEEEDIFLREIDEDLKAERLAKIWDTYGTYAIAGALALVIGVAGTKGWQSYDLSQRMDQGERFAQAEQLVTDGKTEDALSALQGMAKDAGAGYAMLARFRAAALVGKQGDSAGAAGMYAALADDNDVNVIYRDLAVVLGALQELESNKTGDALVARANELSKAESPWRHNAQEVQALSALGGGDTKAADEIFKQLADAAGAPQGVRARAREMLNITGNN
jgi:hypothetical protein